MKTYDAYLCGYYGMRNSGDDALMYAAAWGAKEFLKVKKIRVSTPCKLQIPEFGEVAPTLSTQPLYRGQRRLQNYYSAARSKRIIFGGGSVLHNAQDINIKLDMMALSGDSGHLALGVGLGPFKNNAAEKACANFLQRCDFVGVRDQESFATAHAIAPDANVALTFDLAPLLLLRQDFALRSIPRRGIALNLCPVGDLSGQSVQDARRLKELAQTIELIWQQTREPIYLLDINGHATEGDSGLHQRLANLVSDSVALHIVEYDPNPLRLLQRLGSFKAVITMRLHGAILGFLAGTPVLSLNYHSKCVGWCKQIGMPQDYQIDAQNFSGDHLAGLLLSGLQAGFSTPEITPAHASRLALTNWNSSHEISNQRNYSCYSAV